MWLCLDYLDMTAERREHYFYCSERKEYGESIGSKVSFSKSRAMNLQESKDFVGRIGTFPLEGFMFKFMKSPEHSTFSLITLQSEMSLVLKLQGKSLHMIRISS